MIFEGAGVTSERTIVLPGVTPSACGLFFALLILGCFSPLELSTGKMQLPVIKWLPDGGRQCQRVLSVSVGKDSRVNIQDVPLTDGQLQSIIRHRFRSYGTYPIVIAADVGLPFARIWEVVEMGRQACPAGVNFLVRRDHCEPGLQVVWVGHSESGSDESAADVVTEVGSNHCTLHGRSVTCDRLAQYIEQLSSFSHTVEISIRVEEGASFGDFMKVVGLCQKAHLCRITMDCVLP